MSEGRWQVNDDVKAAIEWLREVVRLAKRDGDRVNYAHEENLLAHLNGEPARLAAALDAQLARLTREFSAEVAAAREEQARRVDSLLSKPLASEDFKEGVRQSAARVRSEPTSTTLDAATHSRRESRT
jgi:hypothetical protein